MDRLRVELEGRTATLEDLMVIGIEIPACHHQAISGRGAYRSTVSRIVLVHLFTFLEAGSMIKLWNQTTSTRSP
jgi:hypothetical protein